MNLKQAIFGGKIQHINENNSYRDSIQAWLPIKNIIGGTLITKDNRFVKIIEILPVNFYLKSPNDRQNIVSAFASYLKIAPNTLQIIVFTQKADMADYVSRMRECAEVESDELCRSMIEDNVEEISRFGSDGAITHRFFMVFEYEPQMKAKRNTVKLIAQRLMEEADTARRYLDLCGLEVLEPRFSDNAVLELLYEIINKNTARRVKLPSGVFDMVSAVHGIYEENSN